jgi:hypothetical protein
MTKGIALQHRLNRTATSVLTLASEGRGRNVRASHIPGEGGRISGFYYNL